MINQCSSCGGFCKKSGCERENVKPTPHCKPLTDEQIEKLAKENDVWALFRSLAIFDFVRAIEAAHGIKGD